MQRPDTMDDLVFFCAVVEEASFQQAGKRLGRSGSAVSRAIHRLEQRIGCALLVRSAHGVTLTAEGEVLFERARSALEHVQVALDMLEGSHRVPTGVTTVAAPLGFGRRLVVPMLPALKERYPELRIDLRLSDVFRALDHDALDVALRAGDLPDSRWRGTRLATTTFIGVASAEWWGEAHSATDVPWTDRLGYRGTNGRIRGWPTQRAGWVVDDGDALLALAEQGVGVAMVPDRLAASALRSGQLRHLFDGPPGPSLWLLHRPRATLLPRVRVVLDALSAAITSPSHPSS